MKNNFVSSEKGQALVLIVLALVALMGFVSLAVDGGTIYSHRRTAQNAADAAAYAGAADIARTVKLSTLKTFNCGNIDSKKSDAVVAAQTNALVNNFTVENDMTNNNGVEIICNAGADPTVDVHVKITAPVETTFMHFVNPGGVVNTVDSVVRVRPKVVLGEGQSIIALKEQCGNFFPEQYDGGIEISGSGTITLNQGGMHSNNCVRINGTSGDISGSGAITYSPPITDVDSNGNMDITLPTNQAPKIDVSAMVTSLTNLLKAECDKRTNEGDVSGKASGTILNPGKYRDITMTGNNAKLTFKPGLYCVTGEVKIGGGTATGNKVTFFVYPDGGDFNTTGGPEVQLAAPDGDCGDALSPSCSNAVGGLLILYLPDDNKKLSNGVPPQVSLGGNANSSYSGTVLAPYTQIQFGGNSETITNLGAQLIGETIRIHGDITLDVNYNSDMIPNWPANIRLEK